MKLRKTLIIYFVIVIIISLFFFLDFQKQDFQIFFKFMEELKEKYLILVWIFLFLFSVLISFLGFCFPVLIMNGVILGGFAGAILSLFTLTIGGYIFYSVNKKYFPISLIKFYEEKLRKLSKLSKLMKKNIFFTLLVVRAVGFGLPFIVHNIFPIFLKAKKKIFLLSTFLGLIPLTSQSFFADGLVSFIIQDNKFSINFFYEQNILIPLIVIFVSVFLSIIFKKKYFN